MAEAGEEKPKRCLCGFWASPQTKDMCSKCYKEYTQKGKTSKAESGKNSNSTQKTALLQQLGLIPSVNTNSSSSEISSEEKTDEPETDSGQTEGEKNKEKSEPVDPFLPEERPQQKNRKKCWICKAKLELAQRELGSCKCGYVFCFLHRLPEQHKCIYNHKEGGRQQALKDMTPTGKKKIGRSFHRMDSRPE